MKEGDDVVTIFDHLVVCGTYMRRARIGFSWVRVNGEERVFDNSRMVLVRDMVGALYESGRETSDGGCGMNATQLKSETKWSGIKVVKILDPGIYYGRHGVLYEHSARGWMVAIGDALTFVQKFEVMP